MAPRLRLSCLVITAGLLFALSGSSAMAQPYLPPAGEVYAGVTAGDPASYQEQTGVHAAVFQEFVTWGSQIGWAVSKAQNNESRLMLALKMGSGKDALSPAQIAAGDGDRWLRWLGNYLFWRAQPTYLRIFGEMNDYWSSYCAFNANGSSRGPSYSAAAFRKAWKRIVLILRGGVVSQINQELHGLGMPPVSSSYATLPMAPVAFLWVPSTFGNPAKSGNQPGNYYPGDSWVDWVGTDFYSKFPNWGPLDHFYNAFKSKPFVFGEWGIWGADNPTFVRQMFSWVTAHHRVRLLMYNQGYQARAQLSLAGYPRAAKVIGQELTGPEFPQYTSEWMPS